MLSAVLFMALNGWCVKYYVANAGFTPMKLTIDALGMSAAIMFIGWLCLETHFSGSDLIEGTVGAFILMGGSVSFATAFQCGKCGPIQSIDSLKSLIPLALHNVFNAVWPTPF